MDSKDSTTSRGSDGLTPAELNASRRGFWDEAFTQVLLRRVPGGATKLLDVGCGLAPAAHALLPKLPGVNYIGVDADEQRLREAENLLTGLPYRDRVELRPGRAEHLPCPDAECEFVLTSMTLQHLPDPAAAVRDVARVLAPGGVFVAVEPDNTNNLFYFDGMLEELTAAFRDLFKQQRRHRRPADTALGPALARIVERERLSVIEFFPYLLGRAKELAAREFFGRLTQVVNIVSATVSPGSPEVETCHAAIARSETVVGPAATGYACHFVPVFVCVAQKEQPLS